MIRVKTAFLVLAILGFVYLPITFLIMADVAWCFHFPWDQGHDTFKPPAPPPDPNPCKGKECDPCKKAGSPVAFNTGNFTLNTTDIFVPSRGISLEISRIYNNQDLYNGSFGHGWLFNYDTRLIEVTDGTDEFVLIREPNGQRERYTMQQDGSYFPSAGIFDRLVKNNDGSWTLTRENGTVLEFDETGFLIAMVDRNGNRALLQYDIANALVVVTDAANRSLSIIRGPNGKIASISYESAFTIDYSYDLDGNLVSVSDPLGNVTNYAYDSSHYMTGIISPKGDIVTSVTYDAMGRVTKLISADGKYSYFYDSATQVRRRNDLNFQVTIYTIDSDTGRIVNVRDPLGNTVSRTYDSNGKLINSTDKKGNSTNRTYDSRGNLTSITNALGYTTQFTYNSAGDINSTVKPNGEITNYEYDQEGRLIRVIEAVGLPIQRLTSHTYFDNGLIKSTTDPLGNTSRYQYNDAGLTTQIIDPLGNVSTFTYDNLGNMLSETDANGNTTLFSYDLNGRLTSETDPMGYTTSFTYDANGNIVELTDKNGTTTRYAYDLYNHITSVMDPLGNGTSYSYDAFGKFTSKRDANGSLTTFAYNFLGHLSQVNFPDGTTEIYNYDDNNNLTNYSNAQVTLSQAYDGLDRISTLTNTTLGKTVNYSYKPDVRGHPGSSLGLRMRLTDGEGGNTTYIYDLLGRLTNITNTFGESTTFSYDAEDRIISKNLPNGTVVHYTYDPASNIIVISNVGSAGQILSNFTYTYDSVGNRLSKTDVMGNTITYFYDQRYRLTRETLPNGKSIEYSYDGGENRLTKTDGSETIAYTYDAANRLLSQGGPAGIIDYTYDNNGNLISEAGPGGATSYKYDFRNRLLQIEFPDGRTNTFTYGIGWQRFSKTDSAGTKRYLYDNMNVIAEYDQSNNRIVAYTHGDERDPLVDNIISQYDDNSAASLFYLKDALGSTTLVSDFNEDSVAEFDYDAFGITRSQSGPLANTIPYRFTGRRLDLDSELMYYRYRYYNPNVGRFITADPLGDIDGPNLYAYVLNNPISLIDPSGTAITYTGCNASQKTKLQAAMNNVKNTVNHPPFKCFISKSLGGCLIKKTSNLELRCHGGGCTTQPNLAGEAATPGDWVRICNIVLNSTSGLSAVLFHEMTHSCGAPENTAEGCENRCYEGRGATKPGTGESCDDCKL